MAENIRHFTRYFTPKRVARWVARTFYTVVGSPAIKFENP
jgi:hypothetical protein